MAPKRLMPLISTCTSTKGGYVAEGVGANRTGHTGQLRQDETHCAKGACPIFALSTPPEELPTERLRFHPTIGRP